MPVFKFVIDYWVHIYVFVTQNLDLPFSLGYTEETRKIKIVPDIFRYAGFISQDLKYDKVFNVDTLTSSWEQKKIATEMKGEIENLSQLSSKLKLNNETTT
jgi:hypothetical protein